MLITDIIRDRKFTGKLLALTFPITLQQLMLALVAAADALMLGKLDQDAMAAVSLATQIQFVQNMLLGAICSGVAILGAQYWGKNDRKVLGEIFGISIRESLIVSLVFFSGCYFFPEYLMRIFASDPHLIALGAGYLKVASWSYLLTGISQCYLAIMRVSENAAMSAFISSGAVVMNIVFNAVFIFGFAAIPALGVIGAAVATVIARIIELLWCIGISFKPGCIRLDLRELWHINWLLEGDFWKYSLPILGSFMLWGIGFTSYTAIMGHMGPDAAAANAIAAVVRDLLCCMCNGVAGAASILIGNELGAGHLETGKRYGDRITLISFLIGLSTTVIILASIPLFTGFVKLTPLAGEYMTGMFIILSVYMIGRCVCTVVINGIFYSGGDAVFDVVSLVVCMWGIALPCAFSGAFYFHWPVLVVYACTCLDEVGKIPWVMIHYRRYKWVKNITR
ncbi:MAG: MATE family efflux transporter [Lentisphaerae bacterium]|nr:MATE family efflux transporter [Lentisphaerota bacterium]